MSSFDGASRIATLAQAFWATANLRNSQGAARESARRKLVDILGDARGIPLKLAQFLSTQSEARTWEELSSAAEPLPLDEVLPSITHRLGKPLEQVLSNIEPGAAAASFGQVHPATLTDGRKVAVKVQYEGVAESLRRELALAGLLPKMGPAKTFDIDLDAFRSELSVSLQMELDYHKEAAAQLRMRARAPAAEVVIPDVHLVEDGLLIQDWVEGETLTEAANWSPQTRRALGSILVRHFLRSALLDGEVHADPHPGNYLFRGAPTPQVVQLDFGSVVRVSAQRRIALQRLCLSAAGLDEVDVLDAFVAMGFDAEKLTSIAESLPAVAQILFEPFRSRRPVAMSHWTPGDDLRELLGDKRWWFRSAGPPDLLLLMRAFQGLCAQISALRAPIDWRQSLLDTLDDAVRSSTLNTALPKVDIPREMRAIGDVGTSLRVQILESGKEMIRLEFPARRALYLDELMPPQVRQSAVDQGIDLNAIMARATRTGLAPQTLFTCETATGRTCRVWLE